MERNEIENWIDEHLTPDINTSTPRHHSKKALVAVSILITLSLIVSAGIVNHFAQINASITVEGVIYVDGEQQQTINEAFTCYPGNVTNLTHNISNIHGVYTYQLNLSIISVDEGLTVTFYNETEDEIKDITVLPNSYELVNFSYYVLPNADPNDSPYNATIEIQYLDAWST